MVTNAAILLDTHPPTGDSLRSYTRKSRSPNGNIQFRSHRTQNQENSHLDKFSSCLQGPSNVHPLQESRSPRSLSHFLRCYPTNPPGRSNKSVSHFTQSTSRIAYAVLTLLKLSRETILIVAWPRQAKSATCAALAHSQ